MSSEIKREMPEIVKQLTDYLLDCCKEEINIVESQTNKEGFEWTPEVTINFYLSTATIFAGSLLNLVIRNFSQSGCAKPDLIKIIDSFNVKMTHLTNAILSTEAFKMSLVDSVETQEETTEYVAHEDNLLPLH